VRWIKISTLTMTMVLCAGLALAGPDAPLFGPQTFERTTGETDLYDESFASPAAGGMMLFVLNGDDEGGQVSSASVTLNGAPVLGPSDFGQRVDYLRRPVEARAGINEISVELHGSPGSFLTLAIGRPDRPPLLVHGRLLLPWGRNDSEVELSLAVKNGSPSEPRAVRVLFFSPMGEVVAASERFLMPPRASVAGTVETLVAEGSWEIGSVEIFYAGPGRARLFGTARHGSLSLGGAEIQTLINSGSHVHRPRPERPESGRGVRP
jgi:hypothetical protein